MQDNSKEVTKPKNDSFLKESDVSRIFTLAKIAMGVIGIVASVAIGFSYQSVQDLKDDLKAEAKNLSENHKEKIKDLNFEVKDLKSDLSSRSSQMLEEVKNIREYANKELDRNTNYSIKMIEQIRIDALIRAESAAKLEVNRILKDDKRIEELIEQAIENRVFDKLDAYTDTIENDIKELIKIIPDFIIAVDRIREGHRDAYMELDSIVKYSEDPFIRALADSTLMKKKEDYEKFVFDISNDMPIKESLFGPVFQYYSIYYNGIPLSFKYVNDSIEFKAAKELISRVSFIIIEKDQNLNRVSICFEILNELFSDINLSMFDFERVKAVKQDIFVNNNWTEDYTFKLKMFKSPKWLPEYFFNEKYGLKQELESRKQKGK